MASDLSTTITLVLLILVMIFIILGLLLLVLSKKKSSSKPDIPQSIISYVKTALSQKYDRDKIRKSLLDNGWNNNVIDQAFAEVERIKK